MAWQRALRALLVLLPLAAIACDGHEPLAPSFLTVGPPSSLTATALSFSQISLAWQDNSPNESGFEVHRSTTGPNGSFVLIASLGSRVTSYNDAGLTGRSQYCYEVRAFRVTGKKTTYSDFSTVACATTPPAPVPAAPSGVTAAPHLGFTFQVSWTDNSTDETGFRVERSNGRDGPWSSVSQFPFPPNTTSINHFQVGPEQELACYRVFAVNGFGDSDPSNVACTAMPNAPSDLTASVVGSEVVLSWVDNSGVEDGFEVQRAAEGGSFSVIGNVDANVTLFHDAPPPDITFIYLVSAKKDGGTSSNSNTAQALIATTVPQAPSNVDALPNGSNGVSVYWTDGSSNEAGFRVERSTDGGASWLPAGTTGMNESSFFDYPLSSEQQVCYRVFAVNNVGDSPESNTDCTTPPAGPTDLTASVVDDYTLDLAWTDNSTVEDGYEVWGYDDYYGPYYITSLAAGPGTGPMSYQLAGFYAYQWFAVVAVKDFGYSDFAWAFGTPPGGVARVTGSPPKAFHPPRQTRLGRH